MYQTLHLFHHLALVCIHFPHLQHLSVSRLGITAEAPVLRPRLQRSTIFNVRQPPPPPTRTAQQSDESGLFALQNRIHKNDGKKYSSLGRKEQRSPRRRTGKT